MWGIDLFYLLLIGFPSCRVNTRTSRLLFSSCYAPSITGLCNSSSSSSFFSASSFPISFFKCTACAASVLGLVGVWHKQKCSICQIKTETLGTLFKNATLGLLSILLIWISLQEVQSPRPHLLPSAALFLHWCFHTQLSYRLDIKKRKHKKINMGYNSPPIHIIHEFIFKIAHL